MSDCLCGATLDFDLRFCEEHHRYFRGTTELPSVTRVIKSVWPQRPSGASEAVIDNARERGIEVDSIFCNWLAFGGDTIPPGFRADSVALAEKLITWWLKEGFPTGATVRPQVRCDDGVIAGTADIVTADTVYDLKTVYDIEPHYPVQLGAYFDLLSKSGVDVREAAIIHVTKRYREPRLVRLDRDQILRDWKTTRDFWELTA